MRLLFILLFASVGLLASAQIAPDPEPEPVQPPAPTSAFTIVIGSRQLLPDAQKLLAEVEAAQLPASILFMETPAGRRYRVCVGRFDTKEAAQTMRDKVAAKTGVDDAWVLELPTDFERLIIRTAAVPSDTTATDSTDSLTVHVLTTTELRDSLFLATYHGIIEAWQAGNYPQLNTYLHPEAGLFLLTNPKGFLTSRQFRTFEELLGSESLGWQVTPTRQLADQLTLYADTPTAGKLPVPFCDGAREGYDVSGFFFGPSRPEDVQLEIAFRQLKTKIYGPEPTPAEVAYLTSIEQSIQMGVRHTDALLLRGLFFSELAGRWYLTALDLTAPCAH